MANPGFGTTGGSVGGATDTGLGVCTARDLMIPLSHYPHISTTASLAEAARVFAHAELDWSGHHGSVRVLLVFDELDQLAGLLRRRDILRGLLPRFLSAPASSQAWDHQQAAPPIDPHLTDFLLDDGLQSLHEHARDPVADFMLPITETVPAAADLVDMIRHMAQTHAHLLPVLDGGSVIGVIRTAELLSRVAELLETK